MLKISPINVSVSSPVNGLISKLDFFRNMFAFAPRRHGIGGSQEIGIFGGDLQQQPAIVAFCQNASERHVRQITVRARTAGRKADDDSYGFVAVIFACFDGCETHDQKPRTQKHEQDRFSAGVRC